MQSLRQKETEIVQELEVITFKHKESENFYSGVKKRGIPEQTWMVPKIYGWIYEFKKIMEIRMGSIYT